jgi:hypothetical protein
MTTFTRTTVLTLLPSFVVAVALASPSVANEPNALLVPPHDDYYLPKFGFSSFNIAGYGERVTHVRWGGLGAQLGLEPGDTILSMNGFRLNYHGSWNDALYSAMSNGGFLRLRIRDVRTGWVVTRHLNVGGGVGPITPKIYVGPNVQHHMVHPDQHNGGFYGPVGPITQKSKVGPGPNQNLNKTIKEIAKMFDD